eukprot:CAMPEP_0119006684 /NCGR_PEP_ID=MMETSP1176-20130426/2463_1 /TAXON_ID=265551 /ORGANISM="Synedropsis recta cf, Strain CCMP1620" /LENGTH=295 /DNA_ID=CAMNT_0006958641 /DNA_START=119 /DNA_END=1006 /DNA_ORIENTATION=+
MTAAPWQLYTFCGFYLVASLAFFGVFGYDACLWMTGTSCNNGDDDDDDDSSYEQLTSRLNAILALYVSVTFFVLTYRNRTSAAHLKRLGMFGVAASVALVATLMIMPRNGVERKWQHFADFIAAWIILGIVGSSVQDDSAPVGKQSLRQGLGVNGKTFLLLIVVITFVKLVAMSEFDAMWMVVKKPPDEQLSPLADFFISFATILMLDILLAFCYALFYGDEDDHVAMITVVVVMSLVTMGAMAKFAYLVKSAKAALIGDIVFVVLASVALARWYWQRRRREGGYNQIAGDEGVV